MPKRLPADPPVLAGLTYVRPLGSGGFADVFLYAQDMPRRQVAVKVLPTGVHDAEVLRMFNAEADVLAHLSAHPSIVTVYQAGLSADGRPYIVMEYCPGSLAQRYRRERIPVDEALTIGVKMASALESAHRAGLVHRDIKPSNILITTFGSPVLADFGISSSLAPHSGEEVLAMSVPWSAPEVISEQSSGTIASEVWSLGATVYSLLAGHSPFERHEPGQNTREQLRRRIQRAAYPRMSRVDVPSGVEQVLSTAMARNPADRYPNALAFAQALRDAQHAMGFSPTPLEVAVEEWVPGDQSVDFSDASSRGAQVTSVAHQSRRRESEHASLTSRAREEDTGITQASAAPARRIWPWVVVAAVAVVAAALVVAAVLSGGWV
ncbi:serine/threonine-protein kinase [Microbacterium terrisoli]|jgi:serine/threonine protein kinase|uniref:serine/threonine-protein kinase n=1 Tax=Microbacterium terrisoli TaxID=3242192 RepID=UPI00280621A4|nr:serine/threonine-protein kinase [Microbacterium protaetiae]